MHKTRKPKSLGIAALVLASALTSLGSAGHAQAADTMSNQGRSPSIHERAQAEDSADCREWLRIESRSSEARVVNAADIATLRDFGPADGIFESPPLVAVSPDGGMAALSVRRARPSRNDYCQGIFLIDLAGSSAPRLLDVGGDYVRESITMRSLRDFETGLPKSIVPSWSPDGRFVLYLRRDNTYAQVRIIPVSVGEPYTLLSVAANVTTVRWLDQGRTVAIATEEISSDEKAALGAESRNGYRYDDRFWPIAFDRPFATGPLVRHTYSINLADRILRPMDEPFTSRNNTAGEASHSKNPGLSTIPGGLKNSDVLNLTAGDTTRKFVCTPPECFRVINTWFVPQQDAYYILVNSGFAVSTYSLLEWQKGNDRPTTIFQTDELLLGCQLWQESLLCGVEGPTSPRKLERISLSGAPNKIVFDPNPEFSRLEFGGVQRLYWTNSNGIETYGDLVTPPHLHPGVRYPLVVVQYNSRGFLRGGTGDEYPIHAIAARGFVVLSFSRPLDLNLVLWRHGEEPPKDYVRAWRDRKSVQSSLERGVALAIANAPVQRDRLAITGLSDGATTAAFALINSDLFSTAILSTCCDDPHQWESELGSTYRLERIRDGYPFPPEQFQRFWRQGTLSMNASRRCVPLLMQVADTEFRSALPTYEAWRASGTPVSMYVFPNEFHIKWQPAHRLAIYERNIDWLEKWRDDLLPKCSSSPVNSLPSRR